MEGDPRSLWPDVPSVVPHNTLQNGAPGHLYSLAKGPGIETAYDRLVQGEGISLRTTRRVLLVFSTCLVALAPPSRAQGPDGDWAQPLSSWDGDLPGSRPRYYRLDMDLDGHADQLLLRGFTPEPRGALGRNDSQLRFDAALLYRHPSGGLAWRAGLIVMNLLNDRPSVTRDDRLEIPISLHREVVSPDNALVVHTPSLLSASTRIANPDYGEPVRRAAPRVVQLLLATDF